MIDRYHIIAGVLLVLLTAGLVGGYMNHRETMGEWRARVDAANARAEAFQIAWNNVSQSYEERALLVIEQGEMVDGLQERNEALARDLREADATILSLQDINANLDARADTSATTVVATEEDFVIDLDERVWLSGGGFVNVHGRLTVQREPPAVDSNVGITASFPLTVVISELSDGSVRADAFTGDPRLTISRLDISQFTEAPRSSGFFAGIARALSNPVVTHVTTFAAGFGSCLVLSR